MSTSAIAGRSCVQQLEDEICEMHSDLTGYLNAMCSGRLLYVGEQRKAMQFWKDRCEEAIASGDPTLARRSVPANVGFAYFVTYSVFTRFS